MRLRVLVALSLLAALAVVTAACREVLPTNRYLRLRTRDTSTQSTAEARRAFDHARHREIFTAKQTACGDCHRFDMTLSPGNAEQGRELSWRGIYPRAEACHPCHVDETTRVAAAPQPCTTCHKNLQPLVPDNHLAGWMKAHGTVARAEPNSCASCHAQPFCIDCHQRRDTIQTVFHDRNYRFLHSIEARANPMECGSCHRVDYCIRCHEQGQVDPGDLR